jgi:hypothetical protein
VLQLQNRKDEKDGKNFDKSEAGNGYRVPAMDGPKNGRENSRKCLKGQLSRDKKK